MDNENNNIRKPSVWVFISAASALLSAMCMGCVLGWSGPAFESMAYSDSVPLLNTTNESDKNMESWMGSCITLGALVGGLVCGFTIQTFGRKKTLMAIGLPFTAGWILICIAKGYALILVGRVITGFASGIACGAAPTYAVEIATPSIRGLLGSGFQVFIVVGILYIDIFSLALHWNYLCIAGLLPGLLMAVLMFFMPESPSYLMNKFGRSSQVVDALTKLRHKHSNIESELKEMEERADQSKSEPGFLMSQLRRGDVYKPFTIAICLMFFQQFSGINAVMFYSTEIFAESGSSLSPDYATIIVTTSMVIATISGSLVIDRLGRKILLIASGIGHVLSLAVMGYYYYKNPSKSDAGISANTKVASLTTLTTLTTISSSLPSSTAAAEALNSSSDYGWVPIMCLVVFVVSFSIGFGPIPWMIVAEITPNFAMGFISSIATAFNWMCAFVITKEFDEIQEVITKYGAFWLFAGISAASIAYVFFFVPETKGKSVEEMQEIFLGTKQLPVYNNKYDVQPVTNI